MYKYCIIRKEKQILSFLLNEAGKAVEIHADPLKEEALLGSVYIAKVKNIARNIQAAFVELTPGLTAYLPLEDLKDPIYTKKGSSKELQQGDELVVQISREAIKTKGPAVTTNLSFQGKYVILEMGKTGVGVSRKLEEDIRGHLKEVFTDAWYSREVSKIAGIVIRTNAASAVESLVIKELDELSEAFCRIRNIAVFRTCYSCLYQVPMRWMQRLDSLPITGTQQVLIEEEELFDQARKYLEENVPQLLPVLRKYEDPLLRLEKLYSLERELREAIREHVWLKSGAYLVIQPTEALTVIDVNSGKSEASKRKEEAVLKVNVEAARETARQMRLRNLSGIILVDFINMESDDAKSFVLKVLREHLALDIVQAHVIDITRLNLVELTRKKVERPLSEQLAGEVSF